MLHTTLLYTTLLYGFAPMRPNACRRLSSQPSTAVRPLASVVIPSRWQRVHDCERPAKYREVLTEEDCAIYELELAAGRTPASVVDGVLERRRRWVRLNRPRWRRKYSEIVRGIRDMDDLREVCAAAAARNRSVVALSIYSQPERSNLRVAAKFRRLALKYQRDAACCEAEARSALALALGAEAPSVTLFDAERVTRVASCPSWPAAFKRLEARLLGCVAAMQKRRAFLRRLVDKRPNLVRLAASLGDPTAAPQHEDAPATSSTSGGLVRRDPPKIQLLG